MAHPLDHRVAAALEHNPPKQFEGAYKFDTNAYVIQSGASGYHVRIFSIAIFRFNSNNVWLEVTSNFAAFYACPQAATHVVQSFPQPMVLPAGEGFRVRGQAAIGSGYIYNVVWDVIPIYNKVIA